MFLPIAKLQYLSFAQTFPFDRTRLKGSTEMCSSPISSFHTTDLLQQ